MRIRIDMTKVGTPSTRKPPSKNPTKPPNPLKKDKGQEVRVLRDVSNPFFRQEG